MKTPNPPSSIYEFEDLRGRTLVKCAVDSDDVVFVTSRGEVCRLYHEQDCCESVVLEDVVGDLKDLLGHPLLLVEERTSAEDEDPAADNSDESYTWTFYELHTLAGCVTLRWYGSSNGYYSESVDFKVSDLYEPENADAWAVAGDYAETHGLDIHARYEAYFSKFGGT